MENRGSLSGDAIGFCLLPSELIQNILLHLALPEIIRLKSLNRFIADVISDNSFTQEYNSQSRSITWLFVYKKWSNRDANILHGFTDKSNRWFNIHIHRLLNPIICPGEDVYFLTASANVFLFVFNTRREVVAVNLVTRAVKRIPPSPLGPCCTSSWRRSGMKLVTHLNHFRFLFVEMVGDSPVLFVYSSETDTWLSMEAREDLDGLAPACINPTEDDHIFLNVTNGPHESVVTAVELEGDTGHAAPLILRPRFNWRPSVSDDEDPTLGFSSEHVAVDRLHMYGDGNMLVIKSNCVEHDGVRMLNDITLWGLRFNGSRHDWEFISEVPFEIKEQVKKPYRVMRGCIDRRDGIIKAVLFSNYDGLWDIIWLSYDTERGHWTWLPLPEFNMIGLNMAGIAFSSALTLP